MKTCVAVLIWLVQGACFAEGITANAQPYPSAYPEMEADAAWRGLAASYIRKAERDRTLNRDPVLNERIDRVMNLVGAAVAAIDQRFANVPWRALLIERFGYGAVAFPGQTVIVDANFVRTLKLNDAELALLLSHEAAHVVSGHSTSKLSFMAEHIGKDRIPTARAALLEFMANDAYAEAFRPQARLQEREADALGAAIFFVTGHDARRALLLFDKLAAAETAEDGSADSHDRAAARKSAVSGVFAELEQQNAHAGLGVH